MTAPRPAGAAASAIGGGAGGKPGLGFAGGKLAEAVVPAVESIPRGSASSSATPRDTSMDQTTGGDATSDAAGRVLGLDLGDAGSGSRSPTPSGGWRCPTARSAGPAAGELKAVAAMVRDLDVTTVVVGHPRSMSGASGERPGRRSRSPTRSARSWTVPVELQDERLTTVEAERALRAAGIDGRAAGGSWTRARPRGDPRCLARRPSAPVIRRRDEATGILGSR